MQPPFRGGGRREAPLPTPRVPLSAIEVGRRLPRTSECEGIERAYGVKRAEWYPPEVLLAIDAYDED